MAMASIAQGATEFQNRIDNLRTHVVNFRRGKFADRLVEMGRQLIENGCKCLLGLLRCRCPFGIPASFVDQIFKCGNVACIVDAFSGRFPLDRRQRSGLGVVYRTSACAADLALLQCRPVIEGLLGTECAIGVRHSAGCGRFHE